MAKYLDDNGLIYFWSKIKTLFVQKDGNKVLSTNDFTNTLKTKLEGLNNYEPVTTTVNGLMTAVDKIKLNAFGEASTYALKTDITGLYKYKGSVNTASDLPNNASVGDVYNIVTASIYGGAGMNVVWTGSEWDALGDIFEIQSITNTEIDTICV